MTVRYSLIATIRSLLAGSVLLGSFSAAVWAEGAEAAKLAAAVNSITTPELREQVEFLADDTLEGREAGSRGGKAAGSYLARKLAELKLQPAGDRGGYFQDFRAADRNILGLLPGSDERLKDEVIVIGAHYDHVGYGRPENSYGPFGHIHNGADDNASGVSGLLEVIEAINLLPESPRRSILFAFWDAEEAGLIGSRYWLSTPTIPLSRVKLAINLDMIGRLRNDRVEVYGSRTAPGLRKFISEENQGRPLALDFTWKMKEDSDHWPFFVRGVPSLMFHTGLHNEYHRPSDDVHLLNVEGIERVSQLVLRTLIRAADADALPAFRETSRRETPDTKTLFEQPAASDPPRLGLSWKAPVGGDGLAEELAQGLVVTAVAPNSAAQRAGLLAGDRVVGFAGQPIQDEARFRMQLLAAVGPQTLRVVRVGQTEPMDVAVELSGKPIRVGLTWREDDGEPGVMVISRVVAGSAAAVGGLQVRDRIHQVNDRTFSGGAQFAELLRDAPSPLRLVVERNGQIETRTITLLQP